MKNNSRNNIEMAERFLRASSGFFVILYFLYSPVYPQLFVFSYFISLYFLLTALIAWDPLYAVFYRFVVSISEHFERKETQTPAKLQISS